MQPNNPPIYLPQLHEVIDRYPLIVAPQTPLIEVIALMGQLRSSCPLESFNPSFDLETKQAGLMGEARASCVLITEPRQVGTPAGEVVQGIFTERDLVQLIASGKLNASEGSPLTQIPIAEVMTQPAITLKESEAEDIFTLLLLLRQYRIRHLPITNQRGHLIGVVTPESIRQAMLQPANLLKMRRVDEVMNAEVIQAPISASVLSLAQLMSKHHVSCVVITEEREMQNSDNSRCALPLGIVTERDIVQFQALELDLSLLPAQDVMSSPLFCLQPQDSLWVAHQEMHQRYVRRLVVAGSQGELLGIVTQTNVLRMLDPMEMSGVIDGLQVAVEQRTSELKDALAELNTTIARLENEMLTRERAEQRLRLLESVVVNANDAIVIMDAGCDDASDPKIVYVNEAFTQLTGYQPEEIIGKTPNVLRGPNTNPRQIVKIRSALLHRQPVRVELINYRKDGSQYWVELNSVPVTDEQGNLTHWVSVQRNVTERKRMEQALFEEKELAQVTLQSIGDGVITTDASGRIQSLNPVAEKLTGWSSAEAKGLPLTHVFQIVNELTRLPVDNTAETALREDKVVEIMNHSVLIARNGHEFAIDHSAAPIHASDGCIIGAVLVFRDSTLTRDMARQLSWQANHDALTGLVNRREFEEQLEQTIFKAKTGSQPHILLYLDLDRFKIVNDTCGHVAGDELLRQVSQQFKSRIRKTDTLARLGGDEFAVLLYQCSDSQGLQVAESLLQSIQTLRFVWQDKTFSIGVSIGLVAINADTQSVSSVLSDADTACYTAKNRGRNRVHVYQTNDHELAQHRGEIQWVVKINQALQNNQFCLYSQPIIPIAHPCAGVEHYEVFVRLQDQTGQMVSPMAFIPAAERYHLMQTIDRWVIRTLFAHLSALITHDSGISGQGEYPPEKAQQTSSTKQSLYAINLSGSSIHDEQFIDFLKEQFFLHKIPPQSICFEITETVAIANWTKAGELIQSLKEMGCWVALDDFGSGMSSFAYLRHLPLDFLKIDGNFIKKIVENPIDLAMVESIHRICHVIGIQTIAECVENEIILEKVTQIGIDYAQGYGIAKPEPFNLTNLAGSEDVLGEFPLNKLICEAKLVC
ncbi:MAG: EAL domain-containing protein [Microcoleus vaginatus WJT46-NPBG5]|jgi:diguanylate cyclase (GGDEF)-like protein/PAS domain S-box-containing protein|nr:EAL domain-containing protein [Microcoleus vaginatus WJT46-NPBG5]